jgi:hypothetical protein
MAEHDEKYKKLFPAPQLFSGPVARPQSAPIIIEVRHNTDYGGFTAQGIDQLHWLTTATWGGKTPAEAVARLMEHPREWGPVGRQEALGY